jgi:phosphatidate cytidylyltransferase
VPDQPSAGKAPSNLTLRVISALILAPVVLLAVWAGGIVFSALIIAIAVLGFWEWTQMSGPQDPEWTRPGLAGTLACGLLALHFHQWELAVIFIVTPAVAALVIGCAAEPQKWAGLGIFYVALPAAGLILIRSGGPTGLAAVIFIMLVVWATDIVAYFGGRAIGGPKLWPRVSPNKTWSGGICGLAAALLVGIAMSGYLFGEPRFGDILVAAILSVFSQAGDFLESGVKRRFGAKDSGNLIPGHGGVLDRVDGLFGAAAIALLLSVAGMGSILPELGVFHG